ncbi:hypothetical protein PSHT_01912 [Puccinia striiformis]|uniref:Uncharacterized protein n=1 Tax=Puccinia striiformis TaxID=27350 RepID=A0A2S4WJH4_9BASI|nr:hypothetical protein PSHT_01912 [Puccinia striiformis]
MDSHKKSARHRTKLAQLNAFYQMTAAGLGGSTHQNRPDQQSPGGPPSDIDIEDIIYPLNKMTKVCLKKMMIKELTQANLDTDTMNLTLKVMEGWTKKIGHGVENKPLGKILNPMNKISPPQEAPQDLKILAGFLQVHLGILFPAWMISHPRAVAQHHVPQLVQPSTSNSNPAPCESASLGHT